MNVPYSLKIIPVINGLIRSFVHIRSVEKLLRSFYSFFWIDYLQKWCRRLELLFQYSIFNLHFAICNFSLQQAVAFNAFLTWYENFLRHHFLFNFKIVAHLQNLHNYFYDRYIGYGICKNVVPLKHNTFYSKYATENNSIVYLLSDM